MCVGDGARLADASSGRDLAVAHLDDIVGDEFSLLESLEARRIVELPGSSGETLNDEASSAHGEGDSVHRASDSSPLDCRSFAVVRDTAAFAAAVKRVDRAAEALAESSR